MPVENILVSSNAQSKFTIFMQKHPTCICLYRWNLCGHCESFKPVWNKVTNHYKDSIAVVNIELDGMHGLDQKYQVMGFPTVIIYKSGNKWKEFNENRNEKELHKFIKDNMTSNVKKPLAKKQVAKKPVKPVKLVKPVKPVAKK